MKDTKRGAYRNYIAPEISGDTTAAVEYNTDFSSKGEISSHGDIGHSNTISLTRRTIKKDSLGIQTNIGDKNLVKMYFRSKQPYRDGMHVLNIGSNNNIDIRTSENEIDIAIGDNNYMSGSFNIGDIVVGSNNILIDFDGIIEAGKGVRLLKKLGSLMYDIRISEYAGTGSTYIQVTDTSLLGVGGEIKFGSTGSAFVRKKITGIIGNKVFIDSPLLSKESTYPNALVFNDLPEIVSPLSFSTSADSTELTKRLPVNTTEILALREVVIGGSFSTKVFFVRSSDGVAIIKDLLPESFPAGTSVTSDGYDPYSSRDWTVSSIDTGNNLVTVDTMDGAHVGRTLIDDDGNEYVIVGFFDSKLVLNDMTVVPVGNLHSESIPYEEEIKSRVSSISSDVPANETILNIDDTTDFFVGAEIFVDGYSDKRIVTAVYSGSIEISESFLPSEINDTVCFGTYTTSLNTDHRAVIPAVRPDLHNYLFGEN